MSLLIKSAQKSAPTTYQDIQSDDDKNLLVTLPQDMASSGIARIADTGGDSIETTENNFLRVSQPNIQAWDQVDGNAVNINRWNPYVVSAMTITQANGYIVLNAAAINTANAYAILTSLKAIPLYGTLPLVVEFNAKVLNVPQSNATIEMGIGAATGTTAPTDGAFFRWAPSGAFYCVINSAGVETVTANLSGQTFTDDTAGGTIVMPPSTVEAEVYQIVIVEDTVLFSVGDIQVAALDVPAGQSFPFNAGRQTLFARVFNGGSAPSTAPQLSIGQVVVYQEDLNQNRPWFDVLTSMGFNGYQSPVTPFAQTTNHANSTSPVSATLSNTAAGYTTLGGRFQFAAIAGAVTDYALFAYQVPAGFQLYIKNISISLINTGAAVAVTPTILDWAVGVNSSAVSLATVDGAGTWAPRRIPLGIQSLTVAALVGAMANDLNRRFDIPLVVEGGRFLHIILQIPVGTATALQILRGDVLINSIPE